MGFSMNTKTKHSIYLTVKFNCQEHYSQFDLKMVFSVWPIRIEKTEPTTLSKTSWYLLIPRKPYVHFKGTFKGSILTGLHGSIFAFNKSE